MDASSYGDSSAEHTMGSKALCAEEIVSRMHYLGSLSVSKLLLHRGASIQTSPTLGEMGSFSTNFHEQKTEAE